MACIRAQHCEQRLVFQFRVDNLLAMFNAARTVLDTSDSSASDPSFHSADEPEDQVDTYDTAIFGPGLFFRIHSYRQPVDDGGHAVFDLSVRASNAFVEPLHADITVRGSSRDNAKEWFSFHDTYTLHAAGDWFRWYGVLDQDTLLEEKTLLRDNAVVIMAVFKFTRATRPPPILSTTALDLLSQTLARKDLPTVRYATFSARRPDGALTKPQSVYAPRDVLVSASEEIKDSWEEGLALLNGKVVDSAHLPAQIDGDGLDDLDVFSDFDPDDGSADDEITLASERSTGHCKDVPPSLPQSAIALTSVIDAEADITEESIDFVDDDLTGAATPSDAVRAAPAKEVDTNQVILFKSVAHRTWQALLFYIYSGVVVFAPLSSAGADERAAFLADYARTNPHRPAPPSCRTMYDLAVKLGLTDLRRRALHFLHTQLSETNIIDELFSPFTSRHEPVRALETAFLVAHWPALKSSGALEEKLREMARGERPWAAALVMHVLRAVAAADCAGAPEPVGAVRWHGRINEDSDEESDDDDDEEESGESSSEEGEGYTSDGEFEFHASDDDETTTDDMDYDAEAEAALSDVEAEAKPSGEAEAEAEAGTSGQASGGEVAVDAEAKAGETEVKVEEAGPSERRPQARAEGSIVIACLVRGDAPVRR